MLTKIAAGMFIFSVVFLIAIGVVALVAYLKNGKKAKRDIRKK